MTASESKSNQDNSPKEADKQAGAPGQDENAPVELHAHHVSKLLDEVLEEPVAESQGRRNKHPMALDIALAIGLLVSAGGFTIGLMRMYTAHMAQDNITRGNYQAAIVLLENSPLPDVFSIPGYNRQELLNQALYLDALRKMENDNNIDGALQEFQKISADSHYFELSQEAIKEFTVPSSTSLQGGASVVEPASQEPEKKPILPDLPQDASP